MTQKLSELINISRNLADQRLTPGTGGNFSMRTSDTTFLITRSGADKRKLLDSDFISCSVGGECLTPNAIPSAETALHATIFLLNPNAVSVLHTHSIAITTLSRYFEEENALQFCGFEMQKAIAGVLSHEETLLLPIIDNSQDMQSLSSVLRSRWPELEASHGFILRGHGLYCWGTSPFEAERHIEGYEFLASCLLNELLLRTR